VRSPEGADGHASAERCFPAKSPLQREVPRLRIALVSSVPLFSLASWRLQSLGLFPASFLSAISARRAAWLAPGHEPRTARLRRDGGGRSAQGVFSHGGSSLRGRRGARRSLRRGRSRFEYNTRRLGTRRRIVLRQRLMIAKRFFRTEHEGGLLLRRLRAVVSRIGACAPAGR